ncbi:MAG: LD-carboxypeptidase [Pirellulales bacterium]
MIFHFRLLIALRVAAAISGSISLAGGPHDSPTTIFPKALAPGDTIEFVAPAKYLEKERVDVAKQRLEALGFKVRLPENLYRKKGFLGGTDEQRAAELMQAFADPDVDAIFPGTGGYGTTRIIDKLDYDVIRKNPKILIGFSDITGLHIAINQQTGLVTFHSPNPEFGLGSDDDLLPYTAHWFWRAILATNKFPALLGRGQGSAQHDADTIGYTIFTHLTKNSNLDEKLFTDVPHPVTLHGGKARGRLIGGNLSVMHAMMGSPYEIQTAGKILFIEDVGEAPYRVDRMLNTLRLAGKFDHVAGIILGQFSARQEEPKWDDDESIDDVLGDYFGKLNVPVVTHFPLGHVRYNTTLPVGAMAELDGDAQTVRLLEDPVSLRQ